MENTDTCRALHDDNKPPTERPLKTWLNRPVCNTLKMYEKCEYISANITKLWKIAFRRPAKCPRPKLERERSFIGERKSHTGWCWCLPTSQALIVWIHALSYGSSSARDQWLLCGQFTIHIVASVCVELMRLAYTQTQAKTIRNICDDSLSSELETHIINTSQAKHKTLAQIL